MSAQFFILGITTVFAALAFRRALPVALSNPCGFPTAPWGWPEGILSGGLVALFLAMAAESFGRPQGKIDLGGVLTGFAMYAGLICLVMGILVFRGFDLVGAFGLKTRGWGWKTVGGWLLMFLPPIFLVQAAIYFFAGPEQSPQPIVDFLLQSKGWQDRAAVFVVAVLAAPVTEELIFRGCLYGVLRAHWGRPAAIAVTAVLFALIHGHVPSLPGLLILATGLSLIYERCGSLWAPVAMHATFNALNIVGALTWTDFFK
ncbi:MAG: CPBP family intramembrane metalloprotease [Verrucomicrobiaceae bacterium]|nr:MAG: CPBP family intramembrane metalloprotease [Verrucomicrobiaceae bacterium]